MKEPKIVLSNGKGVDADSKVKEAQAAYKRFVMEVMIGKYRVLPIGGLKHVFNTGTVFEYGSIELVPATDDDVKEAQSAIKNLDTKNAK